MAESKVRVEVGGRSLALSNLDKVIYPASGFTKGEVIDYYVQVADPLLAHLQDRPLTRKRWPDGVGSEFFFEKNAPRGTPDWVRTAHIAQGDGIDFVVVDDLPTLVWLANLAALELHVPQWTVGPRGGVRDSDIVVFDLDPGAPATIVECCEVARLLRDRLDADGLHAWPKTSGNKGAQLYVPISRAASGERTSAYAKQLATELSREHPELITATMSKQARPGKVFIDWSQNNAAKTTIAPYSLRGTDRPQVSTPLRWDEVEGVRRAQDLVFSPADVVDRLGEHGDLLAAMRDVRQRLPHD
ncbi:MAG TPA: non-homologous end-joining DNA ligase [Nocardioidaceae bacterium]|nr:non-homologous end-joining DNA ligase [Nocardioidaceae bacterium]